MNCFSCLNDYLKHLKINCMCGGCKHVLEVFILFFLFGFGLKLLKGFDRITSEKRGILQNGLCSKTDLEMKRCSKISSGKLKTEKNVHNLDEIKSSKCNLDDDGAMVKADLKGNYEIDDGKYEDFDEDYVFDVLALRKLVKSQRQSSNSVYIELEKERMAAATAAEEAMAMILRLQNEKSLAEMDAKQYKRLAKEKQLHDQEVILSLQWLVLKHESERNLLEDQLKLCQQKLMVQNNEEYKPENFEESFSCFQFARENGLESRLFSSLDMDASLE